jgi:hypothetical protein
MTTRPPGRHCPPSGLLASAALALNAFACSGGDPSSAPRTSSLESADPRSASASVPTPSPTTAVPSPSGPSPGACRFTRFYLGRGECDGCVATHCCAVEPAQDVFDSFTCLRGARTRTPFDDPKARAEAPEVCYGLSHGKRANVDALWTCIEASCPGCTKL